MSRDSLPGLGVGVWDTDIRRDGEIGKIGDTKVGSLGGKSSWNSSGLHALWLIRVSLWELGAVTWLPAGEREQRIG